jgi:putative flippase GtrA
LKRLLGQMVRFGLVGAANTALTYGVYLALLAVGMPAQPAWALGYVVGMACSLTLNRRWTFRQAGASSPAQIARFVVVNLLSLALSTGVVHLLTTGGMGERLAGILAVPVSVLCNFVGNRLWVFREVPWRKS